MACTCALSIWLVAQRRDVRVARKPSQLEASKTVRGSMFVVPGVRCFECWRSMFGPATDVPDVSTKLHGVERSVPTTKNAY